jgi:hypothetical protein
MSADREATREATRRQLDQLHYELIHNLVIETTRLAIEVKNLKMSVESLTGRLEFNERRARALESVVVYKPSDETPEFTPQEGPPPSLAAPRPSTPPQAAAPEGPGQRSRRRRRRRGRRGAGAVSLMGAGAPGPVPMAPDASSPTPSDTATTVEEALAPEAQPSEPHPQGSAGNEPDSK